jgi:hypothetical protein
MVSLCVGLNFFQANFHSKHCFARKALLQGLKMTLVVSVQLAAGYGTRCGGYQGPGL